MKTFFDEYKPALAEAQRWANQSGLDLGLERRPGVGGYGKGYKIFFLPAERFRQGYELRCEVVRPEVACPEEG